MNRTHYIKAYKTKLISLTSLCRKSVTFPSDLRHTGSRKTIRCQEQDENEDWRDCVAACKLSGHVTSEFRSESEAAAVCV